MYLFVMGVRQCVCGGVCVVVCVCGGVCVWCVLKNFNSFGSPQILPTIVASAHEIYSLERASSYLQPLLGLITVTNTFAFII